LNKTKGKKFSTRKKIIFLLMLFIYKYLYPGKKFALFDVKKMGLKKFFFQHIRFDIRFLSPKIFHEKKWNCFWDFLSEVKNLLTQVNV